MLLLGVPIRATGGPVAEVVGKALVQIFHESTTKGQDLRPGHAASTAFQISGTRLCLVRSLPSLN